MPLNTASAFKKKAAETAIDRFVKSGMRLGLGTGSTMEFAIAHLAEKLKRHELRDIVGVSTSERTTQQATELKIPLATLEDLPTLDLAIDGADEVASDGKNFQLIKGLGGALLREKAVAYVSDQFVVVVDDTKLVKKLGIKGPLPVEVDIAQWKMLVEVLRLTGGAVELRQTGEPVTPFVSDNGNYILDVKWPGGIDAPATLGDTLENLPGVKAHGLFLDMAHEIVIASSSGVRIVQKGNPLF